MSPIAASYSLSISPVDAEDACQYGKNKEVFDHYGITFIKVFSSRLR